MLLILLIGVCFQAYSGSPTIVGTPGPEFSDQDVSDIKRLVEPEGDKPWLFIGVRGQFGQSQIVRVFCSPTKSSGTIRRGALVHIGRNRSEIEGDGWLPWRLFGSEFYGQVRIEGREFDDIKDNRDPNRPFSVKGEFSDETLEQIVTFIRSSPIWARTAPDEKETNVQVNGELPIWYVHRKEGEDVEVNLLDGRSRGQTVRLKIEQGKWTVSRIGMWVS